MTKILLAEKIDDNTFIIDVLYYSCTSFSKSLYPTIARAFTKYSRELGMGMGVFNQTELEMTLENELETRTITPYKIKRITFKK